MVETAEKSPKVYFGDNMKKIRKVLKMTQKEFAVFMNTSRTYVCEIEKGSRNPSAYFIYRMELGLGVSVKELFRENSYERLRKLLTEFKVPDERLLLIYDENKELHKLGINPDRLIQRRMQKNLKQTDLAEAAGLSRSHISGLERGIYSPSINTLVKLAEALDCGISDFFMDIGSKETIC